MAVYYLAAYVGSGTDDDPYRPSGAELDGEWSSIDFRPPDSPEGRAVLVVPEALPSSPNRLKLGDDLDGLTATVRRAIENRLGVDLSAATSVRQVVADLLIRHGNDRRKDRWNQLKAERDGFHRIYLGGLIHEVPVLKASSLSDNFNRADNTNINVGAPFTWGGTEVATTQIASNALRNQTTNGNAKFLRAESDLASSNHFCQFTLFLATTASLAAGPMCRYSATDRTAYATLVTQDHSSYLIRRYDSTGSITNISSKATAVSPSGKVLRLEVNGSSLTSILDGGNDSITATDTTISGNTRCGIAMSGSTAGLRIGGDDWSAGDLVSTTTFTAAGPSSSSGTITATPKVLAALAGASTSSGTATATVTRSAVLAGPSSSAGAITATSKVLASLSGSSTSAGTIVAQPVRLAVLAGTSTSSGTATAIVTHPATLSGAAASEGHGDFTVTSTGGTVGFAASGTSSSSGSATAAVTHPATAAGASTSSGTATFSPVLLASFAGSSASSGNATGTVTHLATASGHSTSNGSAIFGDAVLATFSGASVSEGQATATVTRSAVLAGTSGSAGHATATVTRLAVFAGASVSAGAMTATGRTPGPPGPGFPYRRSYVLAAQTSHRSDTRATYEPDDRRRYAA